MAKRSPRRGAHRQGSVRNRHKFSEHRDHPIYSNITVPPATIRHLKSEDGMGQGIDALASELERRRLALNLPQFQDAHINCAYNYYPRFDDENNLSVLTFIDVDGFRFLFCGDMECSGFDHLLSQVPEVQAMVQHVDVFVAPHHGRENGICPGLFDRYGCKPRVVVISDTFLKHATQQTTDYYYSKASGVSFGPTRALRYVLTTRSDGNLMFQMSGGHMAVSGAR